MTKENSVLITEIITILEISSFENLQYIYELAKTLTGIE